MAIYEAGEVITISAKSHSVTVLLRGSARLEVAGASSQVTDGAPLAMPCRCSGPDRGLGRPSG